jgi:hypothetical protein
MPWRKRFSRMALTREAPFPGGQRDLDLLAPLAPSYWSRYGADSRQFLYSIRNTLNERYHATEVSTRQVAVRLDFSQIVTDVVPGFVRDGGGYWIPDGGGRWQPTNPAVHGSIVQQDDAAAGLRLRPLARLMKDWNNANGRKLTSFHLEMMTFGIKRGHAVGAWPAELAIVLAYLPGWIRKPFPDPWASGTAGDAYLREGQREAAARLAELDAERAQNAESLRLAGRVAEAFDCWRIVYNQTFPAYG